MVCGFLLALYMIQKTKLNNRINYSSAVKLAEELMTAYRNKDLAGIEEFKKNYLHREKVRVFGKDCPSAYQLWAAIVIYVAHRYANYDYNPYDSSEWKDIVAKTFGNKSIGLSKFVAVDEILNRATKYFIDEGGWIRTSTKGHGAIRDYGDYSLYDMVGYIIESSFDTTISFKKYSETNEPEEKYDEGAYLLSCMQFESNNNVEGIKNLEKAALSGMPEAQRRLGLVFSMGERAPQNDELAFNWFQKAANNNDTAAMYFVGEAYYYGTGCERDIEKALYWMEMSAEKGNKYAQEFLGAEYIQGEKVNKDINKGVELLKRSAEQNWSSAQYRLAFLYARGIEIPFDKELAVMWFEKAVKNDGKYEDYRDTIDSLINSNGE